MRLKYEGFMYIDKTNVEQEMYDYIGDDWSHRNNNKMFKKSGSRAGKTFSRFTTRNSYTRNITYNTESTSV